MKITDSYGITAKKYAHRACQYVFISVCSVKTLRLVHNKKLSDVGCILIRTVHKKATKDTLMIIMPIITFISGVRGNSIKPSHHYLING